MSLLIALRDEVILHPIESPEQLKSGTIFLQKTVERKTNQGIIVSKGPEVSDDLDVADHVVFNPYAGNKIAAQGEGAGQDGHFIVLREDDIVAKVGEGHVKLVDTHAVKRIIRDRINELLKKPSSNFSLPDLENDLISRLDSLTMMEGFEW